MIKLITLQNNTFKLLKISINQQDIYIKSAIPEISDGFGWLMKN
jgi:hypothetical protein